MVGVPDDLMGYAIWAFVVQAGDDPSDSQQIIRQCAQIMEPAAVPRKVILLNAFPTNSNGKIDKDELKKIAHERHKNLVTSHA